MTNLKDLKKEMEQKYKEFLSIRKEFLKQVLTNIENSKYGEKERQILGIEKTDEILENAGFDVDMPAFRQGQDDFEKGIEGFNPYGVGTIRAKSYDLGIDTPICRG